MDTYDVEADGQHLKLTIEEIRAMEKRRREKRLGIVNPPEETPEEAELRAAREWAEGNGLYDDVGDHFKPEHR